jgi:20S proteasome subunit alpha 7
MSGTGYDLSTSIYSQDGRVFQIEYGAKNISNAETVMGVVTSDGVILATEKIRHNPLLVEDANRRIFNVTESIGLLICGRVPDGKDCLRRARQEAKSYRNNFGIEIALRTLVDRLANYIHAHTIYNAYRPYGSSVLLSGYNNVTDKFELYMIDNSGVFRGYYACANGKGREIAKTQVEAIHKSNVSSEEALQKGKKMEETNW